MHTREHDFTIVAAVDLYDHPDVVTDRALYLASRHRAAVVHFVYVRGSSPHPTEDDATSFAVQEEQANLERHVTERVSEVEVEARPSCYTHVRTGDPVTEIQRLALDAHADMIVVSKRSQTASADEEPIGSVSEGVLKGAHCPVLVVEPRAPEVDLETHDNAETCPSCIHVRAESEGTQWFCKRHSSPHLHLSSYLHRVLDHTTHRNGLVW